MWQSAELLLQDFTHARDLCFSLRTWALSFAIWNNVFSAHSAAALSAHRPMARAIIG
jgi:hypothetical protein